MGQAKLYGQKSSGININGIIQDYYVYAGEKVSAGDLVEYITGIGNSTQEYEQQVRKTTTSQFDGIAKTSGVGGDETGHNDKVKVYAKVDYYQFNLIKNGDFSDGLDGWVDLNPLSVTWSTNDDGLTFISGGEWSGIKTGKEQIIKTQIPAGHVFYASMIINGEFGGEHSVCLGVANESYATTTNATNVTNIPTLFSVRSSSATSVYDRVQIWVRSVKNGDTATITGIRCYDLTAIFGTGNEPTKEWCDENL